MSDPQLVEMQQALKNDGIDATRLVVLFLGGIDSVMGEVCRDRLPTQEGWIVVKNPKLLSRMTFQDRRTGEVKSEIRFSDFDFVHEGIVEFNPIGFFILAEGDVTTQLAYCSAYLGFLEGRRIDRMKQAGLVLPGESKAPQQIDDLVGKIRAQ